MEETPAGGRWGGAQSREHGAFPPASRMPAHLCPLRPAAAHGDGACSLPAGTGQADRALPS